MHIKITELKKEHIKQYHIKDFLFQMIKENYHLDYVPKYHYDIMQMSKYYIDPAKNNFFIAIDEDYDKLIGTSGIRSYDKDYHIKDRSYNSEKTASLYRLFVERPYRHNKIATAMLKKIENFCKEENYHEIYLHTQKDSYGALPFWLHHDFKIVENTKNALGTIHMEKIII